MGFRILGAQADVQMAKGIESRVCVIGAGCSGITAVKNLVQAGIKNVICYEKSGEIGGNWVYNEEGEHSSVYESTHIISSKSLSAYQDFPMPEHYPDYPSHKQVLEYFRSYVDAFGLNQYIQFNTSVEAAEKIDGERWKLTLSDGSVEEFDYLLVANGHHWNPRLPQYPGEFTGEFMHSHSFKHNRPFSGQRVLIIGAGNSGCDCAVEISRVAEHVDISMRRGYYIVPKFLLGKPTDEFNQMMLNVPDFIAGPLRKMSWRLLVGDYDKYGLQKPDYPLLKSHPVANSELLYFLRHGKVHPKPDVERFDGDTVHFKDGSSSQYDTVIAATGYKISFPFFDKSLVDFEDAYRVPLYLRTFHAEHRSMFFVGLVQPQGCIWPLSDYQSQLIGNIIAGRTKLPDNLEKLAEEDADRISREFTKSKRHSVEVHYHSFVKDLKKHIPRDAPKWKQQHTTA